MPRSRGKPGKCLICAHPQRYEIELALVSGVSAPAVAKKYDVSHDSAWRHLKNHVPPERRAHLVAGPMKLQELAQKATSEGLSLLDYLILVRSTLVARFLVASEAGDNPNTALLAGRLTECLRLMAQVSGELTRATSTVNNNTLVMASPFVADLQTMLIRTLQPYPEARAAVLGGLEELSARTLAQSAAPLLIESHAR